MSQLFLFCFGAVIFFIVITGSFLYGLATVKSKYNEQNAKGPVAQWSEQGTHNPLVVGSIPTGPTSI